MSYKYFGVFYNDGEALLHTDLNDMQDNAHAGVQDGMIGALYRRFTGPHTAEAPDTNHVYMYGLYPSPTGSATALQITNPVGTIWFAKGSTFGSGSPNFLPYRCSAGELATILNAGDVTHPRWDLISVKVEETSTDTADNATRDFKDATTGVISSQTFVKKKKTKLTKTYTPGTPAAVPNLPAVPAGDAPWCYIFVPTAFSAAIDPTAGTADIVDAGRPIGFHSGTLLATQGILGSTWTTNLDGSIQNGAASDVAYYPIPLIGCDPWGSILAAVTITGEFHSTPDEVIKLVRLRWDTVAQEFDWGATRVGISDFTGLGGSPGTIRKEVLGDGAIASAVDLSLWCNGHYSGVAERIPRLNASPAGHRVLALKITSSATVGDTTIRSIGFEVLRRL